MMIWNRGMEYIKAFVKWGLLALAIGGIGGAVGSGFHKSVDLVSEVRAEHPWLLLTLPIAGCIIAGIYHACKRFGSLDTNRVIRAVNGEDEVPLILAPVIFVSATISHLAGASVGREGAALQLGGSVGNAVSRAARLSETDTRIMVMAGMAAVFSALFGTPLAAAFFAIEVAVVGTVHYTALLPCIISSFTAYRVALLFGVAPVRFAVPAVPALSVHLTLEVTVLAVACALLSIGFCLAVQHCEKLGKSLLPNAYLRTVVGAVLVIGAAWLLGTSDYNGAGMEIIERALQGEAHPAAWGIKLAFTAVCIAAGFKGGEIVPTFFVGATFGCVVGSLLGLSPALGAAIGFIALFCGVVNCPTASILLSAEVFGADGVMMFAYVCVIVYLLSGNFGLYKSQKRLHSKLEEAWA